MKTLYIFATQLLTVITASAQLKNTKWQGKLNVPDETNVILDFKKDSVDMIIVDAGIVGESMTYSVKDSTITMNKTFGHSPCNVGDVFKLKYAIKGDKLFISNISDPCDMRVQAWTKEPLTRLEL